MAISARHADTMLHKFSRKAVCIALNYADHAKEMGSTVDREAPFYFFKPTTSYLPENTGPIRLPKGNAVVQHEVELGVVIGKPAKKIKAADAHNHIAGWVCAIDVTARKWQHNAKSLGRPWSAAKGLDTFLPVSSVLPPDSIQIQENDGSVDVNLFLEVNGERKQYGSTKNMIWTVPEILEKVSEHVTLEEWDIVLTGTPSGIGPKNGFVPGDKIKAGIENLVEMNFYTAGDE